VRRREFITLLGGAAAAWPLAAHAQERVPTIGILRVNPKEFEYFAEPFRGAMKELGWEEGRNIRFEFVWAGGRNEAVAALARDLVAGQSDIILAFGNPGISAVQRATPKIPIVGMSDDMVGEGLAASMARPGGHTTGVSILGAELDVKRFELLHEYVPQARRIAILKDPTTGANQHRLEQAAERLNLELVVFTARNVDEVGRALDGIIAAGIGGVNVLASPMLNGARRIIIDRLRDNRLPSIYEWPESADDGGLLGYGAPVTWFYRRVAVFADKILRGARPGDLPIEQPTKFELVVNLRTASAIGLMIPAAAFARRQGRRMNLLSHRLTGLLQRMSQQLAPLGSIATSANWSRSGGKRRSYTRCETYRV
jgi:putative ABC transport system substrate-binding protein